MPNCIDAWHDTLPDASRSAYEKLPEDEQDATRGASYAVQN